MNDLFGTSGIRGVVGEEITSELAVGVSRSIAEDLGNSGKVLIGRDTRLSGEMIEDALVSGFLSSGLDVDRLGIVPTPVVGYSVSAQEAEVGVMITASHNPPEYNGIKLFGSNGVAFSPEREKKVESTYYSMGYSSVDWESIDKLSELEVLDGYLEKIAEKIEVNRGYRVVVDCACGSSAVTTPYLLEELGCEVLTLNSHLDGRFPGRSPEPIEENLGDLMKSVKESGADLGIAHDGDGDRVAVVDETGKMVGHDKLLALVSAYSTERFGGGVVTTVDASKVVDEQVSEAGGKVLRTKVGDVAVVNEMRESGMVFGGEPSGTWIMGDVHMCPDGTLAAARILEMLDSLDGSMSELIDSLPSYPIMRDKVDCENERKVNVMSAVIDKVPSEFSNIEEISTQDGVRLRFFGGEWILIRPSGTEPYIRVTAEADEEDRARSFVQSSRQLLESVKSL